MKVIFLTLVKIDNIEHRGLYHDLMRVFCDEGHEVVIVTPNERRFNQKTTLVQQGKLSILKVWTPNIQKTNLIEKGIGTILIEYFYKRAIKKYFDLNEFDLILYSTPPITFTSLIKQLKLKGAKTYLLLKDIFPQNAVDLGMLKPKGLLHLYFRRKEKELYKISDRIGCMSPANVKYLLEHNHEINPEKVEVNPNSYQVLEERDIQSSDNLEIKRKYGIPNNKTIFIYGGNLGKPQGLDSLPLVIDYCSIIQDAFFIIVGDGTEYPKIKKWISTNNPSNALLIPNLPQEEYNELLKLSHVGLVFLNPKFTIPNFPSRTLSYLEHKMPIICATDNVTDIGLIAESNGFGYHCLNGDLELFKQFVIGFTIDKEKISRMGEIGYQFMKTHYKVNLSYEKIIQH